VSDNGRHEAIELIERSALAESSKESYRRVLLPFLQAGHRLDDPNALLEYAGALTASRKKMLHAALALWTREKIERLRATVTPENLRQVQVDIIRLQALPRLVKIPKQSGQRAHTWLSPQQIRALYEACGDGLMGLRDRVVLGLMLTTGIRRLELIHVKWEHIVEQTFEGELCPILNVIKGKGGQSRAIPLTPQVVDLLGEWAVHTGRDGYIVRSLGNELAVGDSLSDPQVYNIVRKRGAMIAVPTLAPHDLRRTFAQGIWEKTRDLLLVSDLMGHKQVETTRRYLQLDEAKKREAVRAIAWG
jgi:integrase